MNFSVCIPAVCRKMNEQESLKLIKEVGYDKYEIWSWWDRDMEVYRNLQETLGLEIVGMCTKMISLTDEECREEYIQGLRETIEICKKMNCKKIISQVGQDLVHVPREIQHESIVKGLKACVPYLEDAKIILVIEPLNIKINHKGYYLWQAQEAFEIVEQVGSEYVKVLYDMYHQHISGDLSTEAIEKNIDKIGHFHMAGYPGRNEPFVDCEIDYLKYFEVIKKTGYQGNIGLEYIPLTDEKDGLGKFKKTFSEGGEK